MYKQILRVIGVAIVVTLTVTASAMARAGDRTAAETYPVATALCVNAHAATLPPRLEPSAAKVIVACDTLANAFGPLVSTVDAAEAQFLSTVSNQKSLVAAACPRPVKDHAACLAARTTKHTTNAAARVTLQSAVATFHTAVEANRTTFWSTIQPLRGASSTSQSG
jgi:hypothetical protein